MNTQWLCFSYLNFVLWTLDIGFRLETTNYCYILEYCGCDDHVFSHSFVTHLSIPRKSLCTALPDSKSSILEKRVRYSTSLQQPYLALARPSRQFPVPTDSERPLNPTPNTPPRGRKERHQRHQRHQPQQQHQQRRHQQPPVQPDVIRERRVFETTSEQPEPGRDFASRSPRTTPAPKQTIPHTYPPSRRKSRASTSQAGHSRGQIPSSGTLSSLVCLCPKPEPSISVQAPAAPSSQPLPNNEYPATAPKLPPPLPLPLPLPTPSSILLPPPHRQPQHQQPKSKPMVTEHRDQRDGKPGLRTWWQHITTTQKPRPHAPSENARARSAPRAQALAQEYVPPPPGAVFGRPLMESLRYASVQISTADATGRLYVWGYIPVVVAKWCVYVVFISLIPSFLLLSIVTYLSPKKSTHAHWAWAVVAYTVACS